MPDRKDKTPAEGQTPADDIAKSAAENTLALNPLVGIRGQDMVAAGANVMRAMASQPQIIAKQWMSFAGEMANIMTNASERAPEGKDRRFADPAWRENGVSKALMQSYLAWAEKVTETVEALDLPDRDAARARLVTSIYVDAMAPSNNFFANPTAIKKLYETKGKSAVDGVQNLVSDLVKNGGLPASVDTSKFKVGENLAVTPGDVVFRNEVIELIQYKAVTPTVRKRPFMIVPPQINKYYAVDMAPGKSMIEFLLANGIQPFCVSWRNPTAAQKEWDFETYINALDEATAAVREITGSDSINMMGSCSGGITLSLYLAWLAAQDRSAEVEGVVLAVCVLNTEDRGDSDFGSLVSPATIMAAKTASEARGVLDGQDMAKMFAWMRPNDLIWNYWVNNYLLGNAPPAFDVLFWNADTTRLPTGLHHDFLDMIYTNPFVNPGKLSVGGRKIDMRKVKHKTYVIGGTTDHITPWKAVYDTARLFGDDATYVLSNSGHLQSLLNPPGNPKSWYVKGSASAAKADDWSKTAEKHEGTWWLDWVEFLKENGDEEVKAPKSNGSRKNKSLGAAPGTYVFEP
ncbi:MAG: alpha/beta fold hydrolase [Pseudomonadota bacterium]